MTKFEELLDTHTLNYRNRNTLHKSQVMYKDNRKFIISLYLLIVIYPIGAWLSFWSFSSVAMSTIIIITIFMDYSDPKFDMEFEDIRLYIIETERDIMASKVDTDKQINELLTLNKELLAKVDKLGEPKEDRIVAQEEATKAHTLQLEKNILKKIDKSAEQLDTVIAEKTEVVKTALAWHSRTLDLDIKANKLEFKTLDEKLERINERNEELYEMYEPLMTYVYNLTDDMEYGKLLSEQIRIFMKRSAEQIEKNEKLAEEVEIMLAYQRNQRSMSDE